MKRLIVMVALSALVLGIAGTALAEHGPQDPFRPVRTTGVGGTIGTMEHGPQDPFKPGGSAW